MILVWIAVGVLALFGLSAFVGAPYVPTLQAELRRAFTKLYPVGKRDVVVDLGAGDGRVLIEAVRCGARAYGYEINPLLVLIAKLRLKSSATVQLADMWSVKLPPDTTLVYIFTVSRDSKRLGRYLQAHADTAKRPLRVMTFGPKLVDHEPVNVHRGHSLYEIQPLA
jgi:SAM-dependent methyltransferase